MGNDHLLRPEGILPTCACVGYGVGFLCLFAYAVSASSTSSAEKQLPPFDVHRLRPVVLVTIGWNALYCCFLQGQAAAAFWVHKLRREVGNKKNADADGKGGITFASVKYGTHNANVGLILTMDRSVGNMLEQTPSFLVSLWLHALIGSADEAAWLGWVWLFLRASYPLAFAHPSMSPALWGVQRRIGISWISFVTWPSYMVVWYLLLGAAKACS